MLRMRDRASSLKSISGVRHMKFIHLGDLHLGKSLNDFDLIEDQKYILDRILDMAVEKSVDAILVAGDVYDKSVPAEAAVRLLDNFIKAVTQKGIKLFMISGNHDSDERLNFGSSIFESNGVYINARFDGRIHRYAMDDGRVNVYLMPFIKASQVRHFYPDADIKTYDDAVRTVLDNSDIDPQAVNVLVAHQFVAGKSEVPQTAGSEGMAVLNVGLVDMIGCDCYDAFDYVALGHIHSPQRIGRDEVRYSGSILKYSLKEANNEKSVPIVTVGGDGSVEIELEELKPRRNLRHIKGKLHQLLDPANVNENETDDYIYATLTDEEIINDAMGIFRQVFPNTIKIDYENSHTRDVDVQDIATIAQNKPFKELISEFYSFMYGCDISPEELKVIREIAREAGVEDEAD